MANRFIVLEGLDGSGKTTQASLLVSRLEAEKKTVKQLKFPDYDSESSALVKLYLAGKLGGLDEVNVYAATSFYAADRYISYTTQWKEEYERGTILVSDRYTSSNIIYQMAKLPQDQWDEYINWITNYEYTKMQLPIPSDTLYLDLDPMVSRQLLNKRYEGDSSRLDLHEQNLEYLFQCRKAALYAAPKLDWQIISCTEGEQLLSIEAISAKIWNALF